MSDRQVIEMETRRGDLWRSRASAAEQWWMEAAPLLADIGRRYTLDQSTTVKLRSLLSWEPEQSAPSRPPEEAEPYLWEYMVNGCHVVHSEFEPPSDAYDEGTLVPLYRRPIEPPQPAEATGCEWSDDGKHECKECDTKWPALS